MANEPYRLTQTGAEVQADLNDIEALGLATEETAGKMSAADKQKLDGLPSGAELEGSLGGKVDKVNGKGLSTEDFTSEEKSKLGNLPTSATLETALAGKVDKVPGKGLSTNDFSDEEKAKTNSAYQKPQSGIPASDLASGVIPSVPVQDVTVDGTSVVDNNGVAVIPAIPDEVEANPTVPAGTTPTPLQNLKVGSGYFSVPQGGGGGSQNAVLYTQQSLTSEQKAQARTNIEAISPDNLEDTPIFEDTGTVEDAVDPSEYAKAGRVDALELRVDALTTGKYYGFFGLASALPEGDLPGYAYVGAGSPYAIYNFDGETWSDSGVTVDNSAIPFAVKYIEQELTEDQKAQARRNLDVPSNADLTEFLQMPIVAVISRPEPSASTIGKIYLVGMNGDGEYARYYTQEDDGSYTWIPLGTTKMYWKDIVYRMDNGMAEVYDNEACQDFIVENYAVNGANGKLISTNQFDSIIVPVEAGRTYAIRGMQCSGFNTGDVGNVWFYSQAPVLGSNTVYVVDKIIVNWIVGEDEYVKVPKGATYMALCISARNFTPSQGGTLNYDSKDTISFLAVAYRMLSREDEEITDFKSIVHFRENASFMFDNDGGQIPETVLRKKSVDYHLENLDMVQYILLNTTINSASGVVTMNQSNFDSLLMPVLGGSSLAIHGLPQLAGASSTWTIWFYSGNGIGALTTLSSITAALDDGTASFVVPDAATHVGSVIACRNATYGIYDAKADINANVEGGLPKYSIWDTPAGDEIMAEITKNGGGGSNGVSVAYDMGLPRDLPKVYITSELLTVVLDGNGKPTNQITPLTTNKNEVGDLDEEDVKIRIESSAFNFEDACVIAYQGQSSLGAAKKNFSIDTKHKHRFGKWLPMDGFHLKGYNSDWLHIRDILANRVYEQILQTRTPETRRPFCAANDFSTHDVSLLVESGVLCHIDGFPIELYINGVYWGLYSWNLKKHRSNYQLSKNNVNHIQIDPNWQTMTPAGWNWNLAEVRNPKSDSGNEEFIEGTTPNDGEVKTWWMNAITALASITTATSIETLRTFLNVDDWVDVLLFEMFIGGWDVFNRNNLYTTWDGNLLSVLPYDHDGSFGIGLSSSSGTTDHVGGDVMVNPNTDTFQRAYGYCPWLSPLMTVLKGMMKVRYSELRSSGVFSYANIKAQVDGWTSLIGYNAYKDDLGRWSYEGYGESSLNPGFYDSTNRILDWVKARINYLDMTFLN